MMCAISRRQCMMNQHDISCTRAGWAACLVIDMGRASEWIVNMSTTYLEFPIMVMSKA